MTAPNPGSEIFSFHLAHLPIWKLPGYLSSHPRKGEIPGQNHSESFFTMNLGESIVSPLRYNLNAVAFFAWWREESFLDAFLNQPSQRFLREGWHVRMRLYRRWGRISGLNEAYVYPHVVEVDQPVAAFTLARLKLSETSRFIRWGKPVESQVRDHPGQILALAAIRPLNTFSTFSVWRSEAEMLNMVGGRWAEGQHLQAMQERARKDFHREFSTLRFAPFKEAGIWQGKSGLVIKP